MDTQRTLPDNTQDKVDVQARYNALAQRYVRNYVHPTSLFGLEKQRRLQIVQRYLADLHPKSVLDLGCGPGYTAFQVEKDLPGVEVVGIDFSDRMVHFAHNNYAKQASFLQGDAEKLPFKSEQFSAIFALGVLGKFKTPQPLLGECYRVLHPNGCLLFTYPNVSSFSRAFRRWLVSLQNTNRKIEGTHLLSIENMKNIIHQVGFKIMVITFTTYGNGFILFPWSKTSNLTMEKYFGQSKIGRSISMTTFWILQKTETSELK